MTREGMACKKKGEGFEWGRCNQEKEANTLDSKLEWEHVRSLAKTDSSKKGEPSNRKKTPKREGGKMPMVKADVILVEKMGKAFSKTIIP